MRRKTDDYEYERYRRDRDNSSDVEQCSYCNGTGNRDGDRCPACEGRGVEPGYDDDAEA